MLPSMRHFLKFIDGYEKFNAHGFNIKVSPNEQKLDSAVRIEPAH
jgi:hypothetical protein